ncbi:uncharacterized protein BDW43DRAFT_258725 [Aspergillus alliaceus]|uniref:uncharacterized protein n=1 Tax=Petromyces alliaceus TaxID=209559 RepID=UPI0012A64DD5|nr:uncharacterized protein BDW43DRAFT_258725 [Aspergillus alliaceus]KAB8239628.1 hypothetical protein BDW43DRAFT_258725 [Aspergillus alliaceus]
MYIPRQHGRLVARLNETVGADNNKEARNDTAHRNNIFIICAACIVFVLALILMTYFTLRALRRMNCRPKYIPGKFLKDKWNRWHVGASYGQVPNDGSSSNRDESGSNSRPTQGPSEMNTNSTVRRETSIRSIITLPPYSSSPKPTEQVIAREGERGGMDVVVEFPETAEEEESRREERMEALYQVRQQRRQEIAEREARREERRDARARGDYIRLEQLRMESRTRVQSRSSANGSNSTLSSALNLAEQPSRGRDRRISSVSYAELGYVRHDGSRMRTSSPDADSRPLLSNAATMNTDTSNRSSTSSLTNVHSRGESYSSANSTATGGSEQDALTPVQSHAASTRSMIPSTGEVDVGNLHIPPPDYEHLDWGDAPPYESPTAERGNHPHLRELTPLPTIQIELASPVNNTPTTPTNPRHEEHSPSENRDTHRES